MSKVDTIFFTRCPVPTATGLAYNLGWLADEFAPDGVAIRTLQDAPPELAAHHYDHGLPSLVREGGNLFAIPARGQGAQTRLVGLTWIEERQAIAVRPDSDIRSPKQLAGKRVALPAFREVDIRENKRGRSIARGMSVQGYRGALASVGLSLDDVVLVEVGSGGGESRGDPGRLWEGLDALVRGEVDAVYTKGASAVEAARARGAVVGIDLDRDVERRFRVNNGTPRPITVHETFLSSHFDLLVRFLHQTLRAATWAKSNLEPLREILQRETRAGAQGVEAAYRDGFHQSLAPDLSPERLDLFRRQKQFQLAHGFLDHDFDLDSWVDPRPLAEAQKLLDRRKAPTAAPPLVQGAHGG